MTFGASPRRSAYTLVTSFVPGCELDPTGAHAHLEEMAVESLHALHDMGVCHGDLATRNIMVVETAPASVCPLSEQRQRVVLLDMGSAWLSNSPTDHEAEVDEMRALFRAAPK